MSRKVLIMLGMLCLLSTAKARADDVAYASCPSGEGYVFLYDTVTGFQVLANLKCGQRVTVLDARDNARTRVRTADGKEGYVPKPSLTAPAPAGQRPPAAPTAPAAPPNSSSEQLKPQAKTQPQAQTPPQRQTESQPQPQPEPQSQPQSQLQPLQPQLQPQSQPEPQPQAQPQPRTQPEPEPQPQSQPEPRSQPQPRQQAQLQPEPQPAATAFTPFSTLGYGENVPRLEAFGGFSYLNAGTGGLSSRQNVVGFEASVAMHVNRWLAGEANFGGYYKTLVIIPTGTFAFHDYTAMAGPRFNIRKAFFHALVGIDHLPCSAIFYSPNASSCTTTPSYSDTVLAGTGGGGVQWNISRQLALRTSADYVLSRFQGLMQNNFRVTLGIVFEAGSVNSRGL